MVTQVNYGKMAEPVKKLIGDQTRMDQRNHYHIGYTSASPGEYD